MRTLNRLSYLLPLVLGACGSSGPTTIVVSGSDYSKDDGKTVKIAAVDTVGNKIHVVAPVTVAAGKFSVTLNVDPEVTYRIDVFADSDGNSKCEFGIDDVTSQTVDSVAEGSSKSITVSSSAAAPEGCLAFGGGTITLKGTGYPAGKVFFAALIRKSDKKKLGVRNGSVTGGNLDIEFPGGAAGETFYQIDFYVDSNSNSTCDTTDAVGSVSSGALGTQTDGLTGGKLDLTLDAAAATMVTACATFK